MSRLAAPALCAVLLVALGGCGSDGGRAATRAAAAPGRAAYLGGPQLRTDLGNGFRAGLYRLAVMAQRDDDAPDLGQPLPTGLLQDVACDPAAPRPSSGDWAWRCHVTWRTVAGERRVTRYRVDLSPGGCFAAAAQPARPSRYDATIHSYAVDPLDRLDAVRRGC